jgi:hypothetical protein
MLKQHAFYAYHDENRVMARMGDRDPVVAQECETPQEAHDLVQKIINPTGLRHDDPSLQTETPDHPEPRMRKATGFHHPSFQDKISDNCESFVKAAYAKASA